YSHRPPHGQQERPARGRNTLRPSIGSFQQLPKIQNERGGQLHVETGGQNSTKK
ncbi:MAG: hypothetical protein Q9160_009051, partial [Pyrenula sp. 1 TL-2023]